MSCPIEHSRLRVPEDKDAPTEGWELSARRGTEGVTRTFPADIPTAGDGLDALYAELAADLPPCCTEHP